MLKKVCPNCKQELAATVEHFFKNVSAKDGLSWRCKKCCSVAVRKSVKKNPANSARIHKKYMQTEKGKAARKRSSTVLRYGTVRGYLKKLFYDIDRRCSNPSRHNYHCYGGRGIKLAFTYRELLQWCVDSNLNPIGKQIHRVDNDGDYDLQNVEFLTSEEHRQRHC